MQEAKRNTMGANNREILNSASASENDKESMSEEELVNNDELGSQNSDVENGNDDAAMEDDLQPGPSKTRTISDTSADDKPKKKRKRGIIYISSIPKHMNVTILREMLGQYAKISRIYLQPEKLSDETKEKNKKKKKPYKRMTRHFTEGWIEFESKRTAKQLAVRLNNSPIATRKSSKFYDILWSIKYLPHFKWVHLSERLTYEKAVYRQKLQTEISQARKEAAFFQENLDKSERQQKSKKANKKMKS